MTDPERDRMDEVFKALADPSRRLLLDRLNARSGLTLRDLCAHLDMARQSVSKHLAVLEAAGLVSVERRGREKLHFLDAAPINDIADRWMDRYDRHRADALSDLKRALETPPMDDRTFVYTTYIHTTPELLWRALTEPAFTERYWGLTLHSTWEVGAPVTWVNQGVTIEDPEQVVLTYDPYSTLAYTWHTFTPELGARFGFDADVTTRLGGEGRSKVTFRLEPADEQVKLTVHHEDLDTTWAGLVSNGWPSVIAELKTVLEASPEPATT